MNPSSNKTFSLLMIGGIATCVALLPWSRWLATPEARMADRVAQSEQRLTERVAQYAQLREEGDWVKIFAMMAEQDRKVVPINQFLTLYGSGALKVIEMKEESREIDGPHGTAIVKLAIEAELQLDKLPASYRRSLGPQDPAQLRKKERYHSHWYWDEGEWWLRMDPEAVSRRSNDGKDIKPLGAAADEKKK